MYTCKFFPESSKTVHDILHQNLDDAGLDVENKPYTTDKGSNMVAASLRLIIHSNIYPAITLRFSDGHAP